MALVEWQQSCTGDRKVEKVAVLKYICVWYSTKGDGTCTIGDIVDEIVWKKAIPNIYSPLFGST